MNTKQLIEKLEKLTGKRVNLEEAINKQQVKDLVQQKGSLSMLELLSILGIQPTTPPNSQQVAVFLALKRMLGSGELSRTKEGKAFKYSIGNGIPQIAPITKVKRGKAKSIEEIVQIINSVWPYNSFVSEGGNWLGSSTGDRGPRTDHGGGEDGDDWMSSEQIRAAAAPYDKKWRPRLEQLAKDLKAKGLSVSKYYVDYGEKGHVFLQLEIPKELILLKKESVLRERIVNDPRFDKLPENDKIQVQTKLHSMGLVQTFNEPVSTQKLDFLIKRLKKDINSYSPLGQKTINRLLTTLDPQDWKQYKPEPVVQDMQLNSVMKEDKEQRVEITEDLYYIEESLREYDHDLAKELETGRLISETELKNHNLLPIDDELEEYIWLYLAKGTKGVMGEDDMFVDDNGEHDTSLNPEWYKVESTITEIKGANKFDPKDPNYGFSPESFKALMSYKTKPFPKTIARIQGTGHFSNLTSKEEQIFAKILNSPYRNSFASMDANIFFRKLSDSRTRNPEALGEGEYDAIKYYPESGLHPLVQQSLKGQYDKLKKLFPSLENFNVKKDEDGVIRMHYDYKGKSFKTKVDLNGDTGERAFKAIRNNIGIKPRTGRIINTTGLANYW